MICQEEVDVVSVKYYGNELGWSPISYKQRDLIYGICIKLNDYILGVYLSCADSWIDMFYVSHSFC